jgi:hypothetical protein
MMLAAMARFARTPDARKRPAHMRGMYAPCAPGATWQGFVADARRCREMHE